jgi:hypothetical protein
VGVFSRPSRGLGRVAASAACNCGLGGTISTQAGDATGQGDNGHNGAPGVRGGTDPTAWHYGRPGCPQLHPQGDDQPRAAERRGHDEERAPAPPPIGREESRTRARLGAANSGGQRARKRGI